MERDYFETLELVPKEVQEILNKLGFEENDYTLLEDVKKQLENIGWTFEYYLDATPFGLRKLDQ